MPNKGNRAQQTMRSNRGHRSNYYIDPTSSNGEVIIKKIADPKLLKQNEELIKAHNTKAQQGRFEMFQPSVIKRRAENEKKRVQ